jgi:hypothetical protein
VEPVGLLQDQLDGVHTKEGHEVAHSRNTFIKSFDNKLVCRTRLVGNVVR